MERRSDGEDLHEMLSRAKEGAKSRLEDAKEKAAGTLDAFAETFRQSAQRTAEKRQFSRLSEKAADKVQDLSDFVRGKGVDEILEEVSRFSRRRPGIFMGGLFCLGFLAARFLKSSDGRREEVCEPEYNDMEWSAELMH